LIGSFVRPVFVHKTGFLMAYLSGKVAAIFAAGGAISGAVAKSIAAHGAKVYLSGRDLHVLQALAQTITEAGGQAEVAHVDALHEGEIDAFLQRIVTENGRLDIVFNGIGVRPSESDYGTYSHANARWIAISDSARRCSRNDANSNTGYYFDAHCQSFAVKIAIYGRNYVGLCSN
jgi:NAD(P)-dependent dehydrogenase (short-subunit alcohol dehydrogenase family)